MCLLNGSYFIEMVSHFKGRRSKAGISEEEEQVHILPRMPHYPGRLHHAVYWGHIFEVAFAFLDLVECPALPQPYQL